ncbi:MAG: hypothetical protein A2X12_07905 [Bacteroidetes bacterium GWE2_29_8]|nr:MAG: hypothetical protein A2X12_07905 [Bacteroidetes bacterium GWE2_29_8]
MDKIVNRLLIVILSFILLIPLYFIKTVIIYLSISIIFSIIGRPLVRFISSRKVFKRHIPISLSALITLIIIFSFFASILLLIIPLIIKEAENISSINRMQLLQCFGEPTNDLNRLLGDFKFSPVAGQSNNDYILSKITSLIDIGNITIVFTKLTSWLGNIFIALFSINFITFFLLKDTYLLRKLVIAIVPDRYLANASIIVSNSKKILSGYFIGLIIETFLVGILVTIMMYVWGVENAPMIGLFAGLLNVIPYIGPLIGMLFALLLTITSNLNLEFYYELLPLLLKVSISIMAIQLIDNLILQPLIYSNSVKSHPLEIFIIILIGGTIGGILGLIVAVPFYSFLKVIAMELFPRFKIVESITKNMLKKENDS